MSEIYGKPEADDFMFVLENSSSELFDAYIELTSIFEGSYELDCRYRKIGTSDKWSLLTSMTVDSWQMDTKAKTDGLFEAFIAQVNDSIKKAFGSEVSVEPESGAERLDWLIKNQLQESNNIVTRK